MSTPASPILRQGSEGFARVVRVTRDGADAGWGALGHALAQLSPRGFVAVDTEFSGLGADARLSSDDMALRYEGLRDVAANGAVLSLGLAVFDVAKDGSGGDEKMAEQSESVEGEKKTVTPEMYKVAAFDFALCCESPWTVSADAGRFLVAHDFDFNRLFRSGIPYKSACSEAEERAKEKGSGKEREAEKEKEGVKARDRTRSSSAGSPFPWAPMPGGLLWRIGRAGVPLVVHNGLLDLVYLYAAFHGPLPATLAQFISSLLDAVPAGYFDTKHLASTVRKERASFLAYVYAKSVQEQAVVVGSGAGMPRAEVAAPEDFVSPRVAKKGGTALEGKVDKICVLYGLRGHCPKGTNCVFPHNAFDVVEYERKHELPDMKKARKSYKKEQKIQVDIDEKTAQQGMKRAASGEGRDDGKNDDRGGKKKKMSKKQRKARLVSLDVEGGKPSAGDEAAAPIESRSEHSAGWDAYMTGFCFATARVKVSESLLNSERNKIPLAKKKNALFLAKSSFEEFNADMLSEKSGDCAAVDDKETAEGGVRSKAIEDHVSEKNSTVAKGCGTDTVVVDPEPGKT